jgi:2,4-dienoyl-CoA reductase (NADPH2)
MKDEPGTFEDPAQIDDHRKITQAVHAAGGRILLQILHAGRYGYHPAIVAPSAIKSPINRDSPRALSAAEIEETIAAYANTVRLAIEAGYDGVEVMGSEGYLIIQFLAPRTNIREDEWGGFRPPTPLNLLLQAADVFPDRAAVIHGDLRLTWLWYACRSSRCSTTAPGD